MTTVDGRPMAGTALTVAPDPAAVAAARAFTHEVLAKWGCTAIADDAAVCVSELVTNAILYTRAPAELRLSRVAGVVRIEVADRAPVAEGELERFAAAEAALSGSRSLTGRGLLLVSRLARRWGVTPTPGGKVVWAEFRRPAVSRRVAPCAGRPAPGA